jgi:glycerophosphoryl diester phosphodiesterase
VSVPITYAQFAEELESFSVNPCMEFINQEYVEDAHKRGLKVFVWTIKTKDEANRMRVLGVDGLFCNFPDKV